MNIIDALVVELGLDPTKFRKGQAQAEDSFKKTKEAARKTGQEMETAGEQASLFFSKLRTNVVALFAAFTAGRSVKDFIGDTITSLANLGRMAPQVGLSAHELAQWKLAGEAAGGTADEMQDSILGLTREVQNFLLTGQSSVVPLFFRFGIALKDVNGHLKPATQLWAELAGKLQSMDPARASTILNAMGASPSMIQFLLQGEKAVRAQIRAQEENAKVQEKNAKAARDIQSQWRQIKQQFETVAIGILQQFVPALQRLLTYLQQHKDVAAALFKVIIGLTIALPLAFGVEALGTVFGGLRILIGIIATLARGLSLLTLTSLPEAAAAFGALDISLLPVLAILALLAAAAYLIYENWDKIGAWWHDMWEGISGDADRAKKHVQAATDAMSGKKGTKTSFVSNLIAALPGGTALNTLIYGNAGEKAKPKTAPENSISLTPAAEQTSAPAPAPAPAPAHKTYPKSTSFESQGEFSLKPPTPTAVPQPKAFPQSTALSSLSNLIGRGEGSYNEVNTGKAHGYTAKSKPLENMTVGEVMKAQNAREFNAAGKYQVTRETLQQAFTALHLRGDEKFDRSLQDRIFTWIAASKRPEVGAYVSGKSDNLLGAILALSKEFASVASPVTGASYYAGVAGNAASISVKEIADALRHARETNVTSTTHIGQISVNTPAKDGHRLARDIKTAMQDRNFALNANYSHV